MGSAHCMGSWGCLGSAFYGYARTRALCVETPPTIRTSQSTRNKSAATSAACFRPAASLSGRVHECRHDGRGRIVAISKRPQRLNSEIATRTATWSCFKPTWRCFKPCHVAIRGGLLLWDLGPQPWRVVTQSAFGVATLMRFMKINETRPYLIEGFAKRYGYLGVLSEAPIGETVGYSLRRPMIIRASMRFFVVFWQRHSLAQNR